jgi:hypothetical protein
MKDSHFSPAAVFQFPFQQNRDASIRSIARTRLFSIVYVCARVRACVYMERGKQADARRWYTIFGSDPFSEGVLAIAYQVGGGGDLNTFFSYFLDQWSRKCQTNGQCRMIDIQYSPFPLHALSYMQQYILLNKSVTILYFI